MKKGFFAVSVFFACVFVLLQMASSATNTSLNIDNSPPVLLKPIPNQSWAGGNLLNAFDLDDYFYSPLNLTLSYSFSSVENISIFISASNGVSFYPDASFSGEREVIFNASDGTNSASSNVVTLFIGVDDEPPKWSFMEKDKSVIYQSDYVTFSTDWTDNYGLDSFTFHISQGSSYSVSPGDFSGIANTSTQQVQISAPASTRIYWFFCANDTSNNQNCTDTGSFLVSTKPSPSGGPSGGYESSSSGTSTSSYKSVIESITRSVNDFLLNAYSFLVSIKQGSFQTKILEVTNTGNTELNFNLSISGLNEFAELSESGFKLSSGESKKVAVDFFSKKDTTPGQYFGEIVVDSFKTVIVPVVLNINPIESDVEVSVTISDEYKFVRPGNEVVANIVMKSVKDPIEGDVVLHTSVQDFYGEVYDSSDENITLGSSTLSFQRNLTIFEDMPLGNYIFHARVSKEDDLFAIDSDDFEVGVRYKFLAFLKSSFVLLLILLLSFLSVFLVIRYRDIARRKQALNLYIESLELKKLMALGKFDEAVDLFVKMKSSYGEPITRGMLENKEQLKIQMKNLVAKFDLKNDPSLKAELNQEKSSPEENPAKDNKTPAEPVKKEEVPSGKIEDKNVKSAPPTGEAKAKDTVRGVKK